MKYSQRRKKKMRMYRNRRIKRVYNSVSISNGWEWRDRKNQDWLSVDYATFKDSCYILAENFETDEYAIFKMVSECVSGSVKLSAKILSENRRTFNNPSIWKGKSDVVISESGVIEKVDICAHKKPINFGEGFVIIMPTF